MITLIILLAVIAFALFLFNRFVPADGNIKSIINYVVMFVIAMVAILFILKMFGFNVPMPKLD